MKPAALFDALKRRYEAEMSDAFSRLSIYFEDAVAIGEHPQHTEEIDKLLEQYAAAKDKYDALLQLVSVDGKMQLERLTFQ